MCGKFDITMFGKSAQKAKLNPWGDDHPEKLNHQGSSIGLSDQIKGLINPSEVIGQIFGQAKSSERFTKSPEQKQPSLKRETLIFSRTAKEQEAQIQNEAKILLKQLKEQITLLERSEKALSKEVAKVKIEQMSNKTGIYYLRFFEWLIGLVHHLRVKAEEGRTWLEAFTRRKKKRMGYWKMYKKHGTTFGLSHERTLATQTG